MIEGVEEAVSNRSCCSVCNKIIKKGEFRFYAYLKKQYCSKYFYCSVCGLNQINFDIRDLEELKNKFFEKTGQKEPKENGKPERKKGKRGNGIIEIADAVSDF